MKKSTRATLAAVGLALGMIASLCAGDAVAPPTGQHPAVFQHDSIRFDYLLSLPPDYNDKTDEKWPVILFLHGSGEGGSDLNKVKIHGPPKIIARAPRSMIATEFIVVSPQSPFAQPWRPDTLIMLLDDVQARYRIDPDRVYLTGLSMGGFGTWELAIAYPDRFAAIAPMCGGGDPRRASRLQNMGVWIFHGDADPTVPVQASDDMADALKKLHADVTYTRYRGVKHDCWTRSYDNSELYRWFLAHKRGEKRVDPTTQADAADKK